MSCEDQALMPTEICLNWKCQKWESAEKVVRPRLVKRGRFWCCPCCGTSYGADAQS